jgi:cytochrome b561
VRESHKKIVFFWFHFIQFIVGFFSFLLLLCCEQATASFRANLVPVHATFGVLTLLLAVATACVGLTQKAFFSLR